MRPLAVAACHTLQTSAFLITGQENSTLRTLEFKPQVISPHDGGCPCAILLFLSFGSIVLVSSDNLSQMGIPSPIFVTALWARDNHAMILPLASE